MKFVGGDRIPLVNLTTSLPKVTARLDALLDKGEITMALVELKNIRLVFKDQGLDKNPSFVTWFKNELERVKLANEQEMNKLLLE